mgnify:CR=1 FL=1
MVLTESTPNRRRSVIRDYVAPIILGGVIGIGGALWINESLDDITDRLYNVGRDIVYFVASDPFYRGTER